MIAATDVETYEQQKNGTYTPVLNTNKYALGTYEDEKGQKATFTNKQDHWQYILKQHEKHKKAGTRLYIYGHNHQYDYLAYAKHTLTDEKLRKYINDPLYYIWDNTTYFLDTMSFYKMSLKDVGQLIGTPKMQMPNTITNIQQLEKYCANDTHITLQAILKIKNDMQKLGFKPRKMVTAASLAISSFMNYNKKNHIPNVLTTWNEKQHKPELIRSPHYKETRQAYRGPRIQAFQTGTFTKCTQIDINNTYPYIMQNMQFPALKTALMIRKPTNNLYDKILQQMGTAKVTIKVTPQTQLPYLQVRINGKTYYPNNAKITACYTIGEIKKAINLGYQLEKIHWAEIYKTSTTNPFKKYITTMFKIQQQRPELKPVIKMLLNSFYGKFAQQNNNKQYTYIKRQNWPEAKQAGMKADGIIQEYYTAYTQKKPYTAWYVNPYISAEITAQARTLLYNHLTKIPSEDLIYTAADSIMFKGQHLHKYKISNKPGDFKIEAQNATFHIYGEQQYTINGQVKMSGYPKNMQRQVPNANTRIKRMIGPQDPRSHGKIELIGTFYETTYQLNKQKNNKKETPNRIIERRTP